MIYGVSLFLVAFLVSYGELKGKEYVFNNEFARITDGNTTWLKVLWFTFGQYNRTIKAASFELDLAMDVTKDNDVMVYFGFQILKNNEYKKTPIAFPKKLCSILGTQLFDLPNITKNSSFANCPLKKGKIFAYNIMLTSNGWPKFLPEGRFLLNLDFFYREVMIVKVDWYLQIINV